MLAAKPKHCGSGGIIGSLRKKERRLKPTLAVVLILALIGAALFVVVVKYEGTPPAVTLDLPSPEVSAERKIPLSVSDEKSGLRLLRVAIRQADREVTLLERRFAPGDFIGGGRVKQEAAEVSIDPKQLDVEDGEATLIVDVRDYAWRRWWNGNRTRLERPITIDTHPPDIRVLSRSHNMVQGGSGLVIYSLSEACPRHGVAVGENFFPGVSAQGVFDGHDLLVNFAFVALGHEQGKGTHLFVEAEDRAGNGATSGFRNHLRSKDFRKDTIAISDAFLQQKLGEFARQIPEDYADTPVRRFLWVNRELRARNYQAFAEIARNSDPTRHWEGAFLRLPNSARRASFADRRVYTYEGQEIDRQTHLGIDLASLAQAPVPAANHGRVAFQGSIGIYGKTVVLDHGFGLFSTYSHLSSFNVSEGGKVSKGDVIGYTGMTGLAGGDHLHFGILIHNTFVNPVEWWDPTWIEHNITNKIEDVRTDLRYLK